MSSELGVERATTLPLVEPQEERRVRFGGVNSVCLDRNERTHTITQISRDPELRPKRPRSASFSAGEFRHGNKKRRRYRVLPSKFLLGGNIRDPLNLGSLDREEASQFCLVEAATGAITKKSDAVRVIIPPNINDPLNLDVASDNELSLNDVLQRQLRRRRRNKHKRKRRSSETTSDPAECELGESFEEVPNPVDKAEPDSIVTETVPNVSEDSLKPSTVNTELPAPAGVADEQKDCVGQDAPIEVKPSTSGFQNIEVKPSTSGFQRLVFKKQRSKFDNKIVSPVVPQPGVERKRHPSHSRQHAEQPHLSQQNLKLPKTFKPKNELFQYGNYNKYYGYRNPDMAPDSRLECLKLEWFDGKEVLDVGCNIGHITLTIARDYNPKRVVGIDIDKKLINIAQKNIKHYLQKGDIQEANFPKSMRLLYGALKPPVKADGKRHFPYNIKFVHANYVMESDELLETVRPEFDVIMCLSITKWIHLNWGDSGLKRFFHRIFYNLKPGGRFILEPQGWPSYNKRRKLTRRIFENYKNIRLFPDKFNDYLLHTVGFSTSEKLITPQHTSRGFQRPIIVYTKAGGGSSKASSVEDSSTKRGSKSKRFHSSTESEMHNIDNNENIRTAQELTAKCQETTSRCDNDSMNSPNKSKKLEIDGAQGNACADDNSCSKINKVTEEPMDCVSNSQCTGKTVETLEKGQKELSTMGESDDYVCDNINTKLSSEGGSSVTHSCNHKLNQCVVQSPCSSQSKNSNNFEVCTKTEVIKTLESPITEPDSACIEEVSQDKNLQSVVKSEKESDVERTTLENIDLDCVSSNTTEKNPCGTQEMTVCEKSKMVFNQKVDAKKKSLLTISEPRSPNKNKSKDKL